MDPAITPEVPVTSTRRVWLTVLALAAMLAAVSIRSSRTPSTPPPDPLAKTSEYQPDLEPAEADEATRLVADRIADDYGPDVRDRVDLRAILAYPPDAPFYRHRVVYVSAHDRRGEPVYGAWVDLTDETVARSWGDPSDEAPPTADRHKTAPSATTAVRLLDDPAADAVTWGGWSFRFRLNAVDEGLYLRAVSYNGHLIADKISFPVMIVRYRNDACGPYADRIGEPLDDIPWAEQRQLAYREWTIDGETWRELGVRKMIGDYDLYQSYLFSPSGVMEARLAGSGLQCPADHVHWPTWYLNLDPDGGWNDVVVHGATGQRVTVESDAVEDGTWQVTDTDTGTSVALSPALISLPSPGDGLASDMVDRSLGFRRYSFFEDVGWTLGAGTGFPNLDAAPLTGGDVAVWYRARMAHAATDGAGHWHTSGVRLTVRLGGVAHSDPQTAVAGPVIKPVAMTAQAQVFPNRTIETLDNPGHLGPLRPCVRRPGPPVNAAPREGDQSWTE